MKLLDTLQASLAAGTLGEHDVPAVAISVQRGELTAAQNQLASACDERTWEPLGGLVTHANDTDVPAIAQFRMRIRTGRAEAVLAPLKHALKEAEALQRHRRALKLSILLAEAQCATGQTAAGLRRLRDAVQFAAGEGFVRSFVDEGPLLMRWVAGLRDALAETHGGDAALTGFVGRLLTAGHAAQDLPAALVPAAAVPTGAPAGVLSERELQVLCLLTGGHRNRAIAERLFVSETTVKAHLRSINVKLGTESRTHAIAVARQRGLLA